MAGACYPKIVTDGMILCLDVGNRDSHVSGSTTWRDLSTGVITGSLTGSPTYSFSNLGNITLNGSSHYIDFGQQPDLQFTNSQPFTISSWFRWTSVSAQKSLFSYALSGGRGYYVFVDDTGTINTNGVFFDYYDGSAFRGVQTANNVLTKNAWTNVTCTSNSSNAAAGMKIYVNGSPATISNRTGTGTPSSINYTSLNVQVGARGGSSNFGGNVSQVSVYNRELSADEVFQNYNAARGRYDLGFSNPSSGVTANIDRVNLLAYYDLNPGNSYSGSGTTLTDLSGNSYNATLVNSPTYSSTNKSMTFNGTNQYADVPYSALLNLGSSWTIIAVVKFLRLSAEALFSTFEYSGSVLKGYAFEFSNGQAGSYCLNSNRLQSRLGTGQFSNYIKQSNASAVTTNDWRMVTAVCSGGTSSATVTFYNNNTNVGANTWCAGTTSGGITYAGSTSSIRIASINAVGYDVNYGNIELGRLLVYNKSMTAAEVSAMYTDAKNFYTI